jgi:VCBS repeat-containing protein
MGTGNTAVDTVTGSITFADVDLTDRPVVSAAISTTDPFRYYDAQGNDVTATLTPAQLAAILAVEVPLSVVQGAGNTHNGSASWTYSIEDSKFDFIAKGETLTLNYVAEVDDGHGGVVSTPITVSIQGADIVVTGRTTDAAVVAGPAAWHHRWERDDWDALAGAIVAGHVIECGAQATGGTYSFFTEIADMAQPGFPWADVAADGSCVIGKHDGTGGEVSIGTVTSQLLYEIQSERYVNPDVVCRFDTIAVDQIGDDRVRISGTRGEPAPEKLKVSMNYQGGYRNQIAIGLTGLDVEAKAARIEEQFWTRGPYDESDYESVVRRFHHTDKPDPATNEGRSTNTCGHAQ